LIYAEVLRPGISLTGGWQGWGLAAGTGAVGQVQLQVQVHPDRCNVTLCLPARGWGEGAGRGGREGKAPGGKKIG